MRRKERVGASQVPCLRLLSLLAVSMQPREERIRRSALAEQPLSLRVIMVLPGPFAAFFCVPALLPPHFRALSTAHKAWSQLEGGLWTVCAPLKKNGNSAFCPFPAKTENDWRPNERSP